MRGLVVIAMAGCGFSGPTATRLTSIDAAPPTDGAIGGPDGSVTGDAATCYGRGGYAVCVPSAPTDSIDYTTDTLIETGMVGGTNCDVIVGGICVINRTAITVESHILVRARGPNPIVFGATGSITVIGTIDVASYRAGSDGAGSSAGSCSASTPGTSDNNGGGGGAGGSFTTLAGNGGNGHNNTPGGMRGVVFPIPTALRGGCPGTAGGDGQGNANGGGRGGGGGAVGLYAGIALTITGYVNASGAGGGAGKAASSGGGGGGSGGMIVLDGGSALTVTGLLYANGGGGGSGASSVNNGTSGFETVWGHPVTESSTVTGGAVGSSGTNGGTGAAGATRGNVAGGGMGADAGAGGGGGAVGAIRVPSGQAATIPSANASPAPG